MEFMEKFNKVYDFFHGLADNEGGETTYNVQEEAAHADITMKVPVFELHADEMKQLIDILQYVGTFDVTSEADSVVIRVGVNDVREAAD